MSNHHPLNYNSKSMEISNSSTGAIREKRGDWLSRSKTGTVVKILVGCAAVAIVGTLACVSVHFIRKSSVNKPTVALTSIHHNTVKNGTYEQISYDEMLKSFGYTTGYEKDGLQLCNLNPESRNELGRGTWSLLHIMAATYPVNPSPEIIQDHTIFFQLLPRIYPCPDCRAHMRQMFHELPPKLNSRQDFIMWICEAHNRVNRRLNKPIFDCSKHDERWDCGCNIVPGQAMGGSGPDNVQTVGGNGPINNSAKPSSKKDRDSRATGKQDPRVSKKERESKKNRDSRHEKTAHDNSKSGSHVNKLMSLNQTPK